jgi:hypothetical protein
MTTNLISLCASHVSSPTKIKWMNEMIESWKNQTHKIPLYINVSIEEKVKILFDFYRENKWNYDNLFIFVENEKTPQFMHYKKLCEKINSIYDRNTWVIFTDDDDIWDKDRSLYYKLIIEKCNKDSETCVSYVWICTFCNCSGENFDENYVIKNQFDNADTEKEKGNKLQDYWQIGCQLKYLNDFIEKCDKETLSNGYCNLLFVKYFNKTKRAIKWNSKDRKRFVYFWRTQGEGHQVNNLFGELKEKMFIIFFLMNKTCEIKKTQRKEIIEGIFEFVKRSYGQFITNEKKTKEFIEYHVDLIINTDEYDLYLNSPVLDDFLE